MKHRFVAILLLEFVAVLGIRVLPADEHSSSSKEELLLRAGASVVDITPEKLPVRRNGGFLEATADRVIHKLHARALVLDDGKERIAIVVVDSCMLPRELCDAVKSKAAAATELSPHRILISATHTHSAPAAMGYCLGSRADPAYTKLLPPRIVKAIELANERLVPVEIGHTFFAAPGDTHCRRWILRSDRIQNDPFGERTVRAMMHPGYQNPDYIGPAGPVDRDLSMLAIRRLDGRPLALLANFSMHYFGVGGGLSGDYCSLFSRKMADRLAPDDPSGEDAPLVGILSQGTSGDQHWMDYGKPRRSVGLDDYTEGLVERAVKAYEGIIFSREASLAMKETRMTLDRRRPDAARLAWARKLLPDRSARPRNRPEVYAEQAFYIDEHPTDTVVLQALRIGGLGITAIPCEVYGLTGLELKARSPLQPTFNIGLANGASGYIPPPEQHSLGGYTTWPARTAGLEIQAEPKIIETVLALLEDVSGQDRRDPPLFHGAYAATVLSDRPLGYWRLEEFRGPNLHDAAAGSGAAVVKGRVAFHLEGPESSAFSEERVNRSLHLVDGQITLNGLPGRPDYSVEFWFWNGWSHKPASDPSTLLQCGADHLKIAASSDFDSSRLAMGKLRGEHPIASRSWNHVVLTRSDNVVRIYLNGRLEMEANSPGATLASVTLGGGDPEGIPFEGKIDEISVYGRVLSPSEARRHFSASAMKAPRPRPAPSGAATKPSTKADLERNTRVIRKSRPLAYWTLLNPDGVRDLSGNGRDAKLSTGASARDPTSAEANFSGGRMKVTLEQLGDQYSVELWFFNELSNQTRPVTGYFYSQGRDSAEGAPGEHLGIGGTFSHAGRLIVFSGNRSDQLVAGETVISPRTWNHVVLIRDGEEIAVHLNGAREPDAVGTLERTYPRDEPPTIFIGGRNDNFANFRGSIDQVAIFDRKLSPDEIRDHFLAAGLKESPKPAAPEPRPESNPQSPEETLRGIHVRDGFRIELVAAEPLVRDPVAIDWDSSGRLWVVEMADYPLGMDGAGKPGGRVRFLEDEDSDGRFDRSTLFADELNFPTGILAWKNGVLVTAAPDILYLEDRDGDGRSDRREVLYSGFLPGNQQLRLNGLRYGLDNWIYCANGGHHAGYGKDRRVRSLRSGAEIMLGSRDLRIRPDEGLLDPQSGPAQFGRTRDDWGNWFGVQNSRPMWHYVLADQYARRNEYLPAPGAKFELHELNPRLWPAKMPQKRYHSFEHAARFTSACGPCIYRDDLLFGAGAESHAFTCDPFHGIVQHSVLERDGVTFRASVDRKEGEFDFFASTDRWCRPVMARAGPDGALWIVDMYRYMIEHPDWLPPAGKEELRPFYRSGDDRGRIYRILPIEKRARATPRLAQDSAKQLLNRLRNPGGIIRDQAQRMLIARRDEGTIAELERMALSDSGPRVRLHALCTLDGLKKLSPRVLIMSLRDSDPRVVREALRLAESHGGDDGIIEVAVAHVENSDIAVRLQLAQSLGEWRDPRAGKALGRLAVRDHGDRWMRAAIISSAVGHQEAIARAISSDQGGSIRSLAAPLVKLAFETKQKAVIPLLLQTLVPHDLDDLEVWQIEGMAQFLDALKRVSWSFDELPLGSGLRWATLIVRARKLWIAASSIAGDSSRSEAMRIAAIRLMGRSDEQMTQDGKALVKLLDSTNSSAIQIAAVKSLRRLGLEARELIDRWNSYSPAVRSAALQVILSGRDWTLVFLEAIESGAIPAANVAPLERQRLVNHSDGTLASKARTVLAIDTRERVEVLDAFLPAVRLNGLPARGRDIFSKRCATCHRLGELGAAIGPDLRSLTDRSSVSLLASIIQPELSVEPRYFTYTALKHDGDIVSGLIISETGNGLVFQQADGTNRTLLRAEIQSLESSARSFMPEGLEVGLDLGDMADLMAFLRDAISAAP